MLTRFYCWLFGHDDWIRSWDASGATIECVECGRQRHHKIRRPFR